MTRDEFIEWNEQMVKKHTPTIEDATKMLKKQLAQSFIYGTSTTPTGLIKEKEMEIGGQQCHLCGAEKFYQNDEFIAHKKWSYHAHHSAYECGTQILDTYRAKAWDGSVYKKDRHIHAECI